MLLTPGHEAGGGTVGQGDLTHRENFSTDHSQQKRWHNPQALVGHLCSETPPSYSALDDSVWVGFPACGETRPRATQPKDPVPPQGEAWIPLCMSPCSYCSHPSEKNSRH